MNLLIVDNENNGWRLDKFLARHIPELSRSRIRQLIEAGHVRVNGTALTAGDVSRKVASGQEIQLTIPEPEPMELVPWDTDLPVIFEDDWLLVVDKPAGMTVHPASSYAGPTLVHALLHHCGDRLSGIGGVLRPGIVHRLDRDTSGLMIVAKTDAAHRHLAAQLADRSLSRRYLAAVKGVPSPPEGPIEGNIGRHRADRKKMALLREGGKPAVTHYRVMERFGIRAAALVECRLETGRTHQIRVHMAAGKHPLIGDPVYGGRARFLAGPLPEDLAERIHGFPRQALHARYLRFLHPQNGRECHFQSDIPEDMQQLISDLRALTNA